VKRLICCLTLAALPSLGRSRQASVAPVTLFTQFQEEPSAAVQEALQAELASIMNPAGLHFDWRSMNGNDNTTATELVVVTFKGRCDVQGLQSSSSSSIVTGALGWTHVSDGVILPFSDVDCTAVRNFLQRELLGLDQASREESYGRALGRVLAHELYHVLAGTALHGACGVGKSGYTVGDLLAREFVFEAAELRALLQSKAHRTLERAAIPVAPAP
jgi:hypothetical protein